MDSSSLSSSKIYSPVFSSNAEISCNTRNSSLPRGNIYGGIPVNLLLNIIGWLILLLLFSLLRRLAWDYGRIALVSRNEDKWTTLFYCSHDQNMSGSSESLDTTIHLQDRGFCSWIAAFIRVKDADILRKCGRDAVQYLSFQRYLLVYLCVICTLSTAVVLPVNFQGNLVGNSTDFGHTTIANVDSSSQLLWIHVLLAIIYLMIAVFFMQHFSHSLQFEEDDQVSKTLMISNIPKDKCFKSIVLQHFQESYEDISILDIQFAYDITKLVKLDSNRRRALEAKVNSENEYHKTGQRPTLRPYHCGQFCCCCNRCGCQNVDAIEYYTEDEMRLSNKVETEKVCAYQRPLGMAFLTLATDVMAEKVHQDFQAVCQGVHNSAVSSVSEEIGVGHWEISYAPSPGNIYWENLSIPVWNWWLRVILINTVLTVLLFFLTTPAIIMNQLNEINYQKAFHDLHNELLVQFVPTFLIWILSAILPIIVYYSDQYIGYWTRSAEHHAVMRKTFIFLVFMVLILPSLGLTSVKALLEWAVKDKQHRYRWQCIFVSGNGAFFVNYVITSAFIGTGLELMRFSELFNYGIRIMCARSTAEKTAVRKAVIWEFQFGCQYAWMLCIFSVIIAYSIPCPMVTTFGLIYLAMKHMVDRYNIYFAYKPSRINKHIHTTAVNFVIVSVILLQIVIVFFTALRLTDTFQPTFLFSLVALVFTLLVFFGRISFGWFKGLTPNYKRAPTDSDEEALYQHLTADSRQTEPVKPFVANVLKNDSKGDARQVDSVRSNTNNYGAIVSTDTGNLIDG
ncbi:CSC1-like protein 2 isoform X2 [Octopus sinensis]|uniref:CSC1-like protein 2 isoform X2 n=1 Tax=Octopus sinensis TaxID=2607531 RepID=A0A6P7SI93_9MOLL|nr:CSC1-like protein 2 isoform X2 [Octopus sinensis]